MERRHFVKRLSELSLLAGVNFHTEWFQSYFDSEKYVFTQEDIDWEYIRSLYTIDDSIDFNSAGLGRTTRKVQQFFRLYNEEFNQLPSRYVNQFRKSKKHAITALAEMTSTSVDELCITRNATEALAISIFGVPLKKGDEVVVGRYDYPHVSLAWKQRVARDCIIVKKADPGAQPTNKQDIIKSYLDLVSARTRAICVTDLINWNGCRQPTKEIIAALPDHVEYIIVDAAQSFSNTLNDWSSYGATHVATSLHKWFGASVGTGLLYVDKNKIGETWPLFASFNHDEDSISKFEHFGTWNTVHYSIIEEAAIFQNEIGLQNKSKRLQYLTDYLIDGVDRIDSFTIVTSRNPDLRSNLILLQHSSLQPLEIRKRLWQGYKIHCTTSDWEGIKGIRLAPHIFTTVSDIDRLLMALDGM